MKIPLLYGAYLALGNLMLNVVLYLFGVHDNVEGLQTAQMPVTFVSIALCSGAVVLAVREKRALTPAGMSWGFGSALGTGILTIVVGAALTLATSYLYFAWVNPGLSELVLQMQLAQMAANGLASTPESEEMMRRFSSPIGLSFAGAFMNFFLGSLVAVTAAIVF